MIDSEEDRLKFCEDVRRLAEASGLDNRTIMVALADLFDAYEANLGPPPAKGQSLLASG